MQLPLKDLGDVTSQVVAAAGNRQPDGHAERCGRLLQPWELNKHSEITNTQKLITFNLRWWWQPAA